MLSLGGLGSYVDMHRMIFTREMLIFFPSQRPLFGLSVMHRYMCMYVATNSHSVNSPVTHQPLSKLASNSPDTQ